MHPPTHRHIGALASLLGLAGIGVGLVASPASAVVGPDVVPITYTGTGNQTCSDFVVSYGGSQQWIELKQDPPGNGQLSDADVTITISDFTGKTFSWTSTVGIDAVYVKAGSGAGGSNLYVYAPTSSSPEHFADDGLTSPGSGNAISHISFCYDLANPITTVTPTTVTPTTVTPTTVTPTTVTPTTVTPTTVAPSTDSSMLGNATSPAATPTTARPTEVLGTQLSRPTALARTGSNDWELLRLGVLTLACGVVLALLGGRRRQDA